MKPVISIQPEKSLTKLLLELLDSKELLKCLVWRDILVRYKQASLGILWALLRPGLNVLLLTYLFGVVAKLPSGGAPYSLFVLCGIIPWQLSISVLQTSSTTFIQNHDILTKIYFPRVSLVISNLLVNCMDLAVSLLFFLPLLFYQIGFRPENLLLLFFLPLLLTFAFSVALLVSSLSIIVRDIVIAVPYLTQLSLFLTPVGYSTTLFEGGGKTLLLLNPLTGIIEGFRYSLLGIASPDLLLSVFLSMGITLGFFLLGFFFFKQTDRVLSDVI
jgi:lipopolysaccharide transport system permease protein